MNLSRRKAEDLTTIEVRIAPSPRHLRARTLALALALLAAFSVPAFGVPQVLQYQGRLTDTAGEPLVDPVDVTFSIYDAAKGGAPLWSQQFTSLAPDNGRFSVLLGGTASPFTTALIDRLKRGADLHLGIRVGTDAEMSPRQAIASVVYGLHALYADSAAFAAHATTADTARITRITELGHVTSADSARFAKESGHAARAETAGFATESGHAVRADTAGFAHDARHAARADTAGFVTEARHAARSDTATFSSSSRRAAQADTAGFAARVGRATAADTADFARTSARAARADSVIVGPGIAYRSIHKASVPSGAPVTVMSLDITTPAAGYVLVVASGTIVLDNRPGIGVLCHANIADQPLTLPETTMGLAIASVDSSDTRVDHYVSFHCQRVYARPAGTHTFHLNASIRSASGSASVNRPTMTATFVPKIYGTSDVETVVAPGDR
jgi:hypothetical protein